MINFNFVASRRSWGPLPSLWHWDNQEEVVSSRCPSAVDRKHHDARCSTFQGQPVSCAFGPRQEDESPPSSLHASAWESTTWSPAPPAGPGWARVPLLCTRRSPRGSHWVAMCPRGVFPTRRRSSRRSLRLVFLYAERFLARSLAQSLFNGSIN